MADEFIEEWFEKRFEDLQCRWVNPANDLDFVEKFEVALADMIRMFGGGVEATEPTATLEEVKREVLRFQLEVTWPGFEVVTDPPAFLANMCYTLWSKGFSRQVIARAVSLAIATNPETISSTASLVRHCQEIVDTTLH